MAIPSHMPGTPNTKGTPPLNGKNPPYPRHDVSEIFVNKLAPLAILLLLTLITPAFAVIQVDLPLSKIWDSSKTVWVGEVSATTDELRVVEIKLTRSLKAPADQTQPPDSLKVQIAQPESLYKQISKGNTVILIRGARDILIHLADQWCTAAEIPGKAKAFRITGLNEKLRGTFPGRSAMLALALDELKEKKSTLLDAAPAKFLSTQEKIATLDQVGPIDRCSWQFLDGQSILTVHSGNQHRRFAISEKGITPFDGKPEPAASQPAAPTEDTGANTISATRPTTDSTLTLSVDFPKGSLISRTLGRFGDRGEECSLHLLKSGILRLEFPDVRNNPPKTADDLQLLGSKLTSHITEWKDGITDGLLATCDANADGRDDAVIVSTHGTLLLLNRGFGAFLVVKPTGDAFTSALAACSAGKLGGLLVIRTNNQSQLELWHASTPPPKSP